MRSAEKIEKLIKNLSDKTSAKMDERVRRNMLHALTESEKPSAPTWPNIRKIIMKNPITKLATVAIVIAVVVLGLFEFIDTENTSGVVWAEVALKVQASRGVIFRSKDTAPDSRDDGPDYTMNYLYSAQYRNDSYKGDQIIKTYHCDYNTKITAFIDHGHKSYIKKTVEGMEQNDFLTDPKSMIQRFLSHEYRELGQNTVEGVLCEGFETTDPAFDGSDYPTDSLMARIWVSVETGYPVKFEVEIVRNNGEIRIGGVADQFQWDVELDESIFEPNIPTGYIDISSN